MPVKVGLLGWVLKPNNVYAVGVKGSQPTSMTSHKYPFLPAESLDLFCKLRIERMGYIKSKVHCPSQPRARSRI